MKKTNNDTIRNFLWFHHDGKHYSPYFPTFSESHELLSQILNVLLLTIQAAPLRISLVEIRHQSSWTTNTLMRIIKTWLFISKTELSSLKFHLIQNKMFRTVFSIGVERQFTKSTGKTFPITILEVPSWWLRKQLQKCALIWRSTPSNTCAVDPFLWTWVLISTYWCAKVKIVTNCV